MLSIDRKDLQNITYIRLQNFEKVCKKYKLERYKVF